MTTLQDLIDYANSKGFEPAECEIRVENFDNGHFYDVFQDEDEIWEPMIMLGYYPDKATE